MVADPPALRARLQGAGARPGFRGLMTDLRFDRDGELLARDEVLRVRTLHHPGGREEALLGWKGPTAVTAAGYKSRRELEYTIEGRHADPALLLEVLGYRRVHVIERFVEYYDMATTAIRLEWYPRMDVLVEVEGDPSGIESALAVLGLPRQEFSAEPLTAFAARYATRTGRAAALAVVDLHGESPSWSGL